MEKIAAIQMTSTSNVQHNLLEAEKLIIHAVNLEAKLVVLPENFAFMGKTETDKLKIAEPFGEGPIQSFLQKMSAKLDVWIVGGTIPILSENPKKIFSACLVYNPQGTCIARYDKIHLFDVTIGKSETHEESKTTMPGQHMTVVETPFGRLGIAVCYDLRFPELFRALSAQDIQMIAIPSAFTEETGRAHWELLLRARAIENFCYVIGANQTGTHDSGRKTYGHSMIIDPWGDIVARFADGPGVALMTPDLEKLTQIRDRFPSLEHRRFNSTFKDT